MSSMVLWEDQEARVVATWHKDRRPTVTHYTAPDGNQLGYTLRESTHQDTANAIRCAKRLARKIKGQRGPLSTARLGVVLAALALGACAGQTTTDQAKAAYVQPVATDSLVLSLGMPNNCPEQDPAQPNCAVPR